jgi:NADP-dependent aldehyde dehydrogenase
MTTSALTSTDQPASVRQASTYVESESMAEVKSIDPRTGDVRAVVGHETTPREIDEMVAAAVAATREMASRGRVWRAGLLRALAQALEAGRAEIVRVADAETALGETRLNGELTRTCYQLRLFADVVDDGGYLEATIDHAGDTPMGPRPDLRRMLVPLGPVAVFGASNFPLAFSVPGGDTASALAAGCAVVVKAHESHPETSRLCGDLIRGAAVAAGAPEGTLAVVYGREAGGYLVQHPGISAVGFTGSVRGGQALMRLIDQRPAPIPFYGELGSINPLIVTEAAAAERAEAIGNGLAGSFTLGGGQFCTKPGLAFVPRGDAGDAVVRSAAKAVEETPAPVLLNNNIWTAFGEGVEALKSDRRTRLLAEGQVAERAVLGRPALLLEVDLADLDESMLEECFGPVTLVVRYDDQSSLVETLRRVPASLTASLHVGAEEQTVGEAVRETLEERAGRIVYNGYPTGVSVAWAQNHGGGWPASNSLHTSVGPTAIRRFLRPITWQDAPEAVLPEELRDGDAALPRRVDGVLIVP